LGEESVDAIATEPFLGEPIRKRPSEEEAKKMLEEIRTLYDAVLTEMFKVLRHGKRMSMISPRIRFTKTKDVGLEFKDLAESKGFRVVNSFVDAENRHRTVREIFVLEKA
jgi:tRNA G10  N-methylase Trm11